MFLTVPNIDVIDSRDDNRYTFVVVDKCKAPILKTKVNDICYILRVVNDVCHIQLDSNNECKPSVK